MQILRARILSAAGLLLLGTALLLIARYVLVAKDVGNAGTAVQAIAEAAVTIGSVGVWWNRQTRAHLVVQEDLDRVADLLAAELRAHWEAVAREHGLRYPVPIPVRWVRSRLAAAGPLADAVGGTVRHRFAPLPGVPAATVETLGGGGLEELFGVYGGLDSGRVVILGDPGSGKSGAMIQLLLDALAHRKATRDEYARATIPVPVLLTAHGWDPRTQPVAAWIAQRLVQDHWSTNGRWLGADTAWRLVESGRVGLLLDGFDEMSEQLRAMALRALNEQAGFRVVVASRAAEHLAGTDGGRLLGAAAVQMVPVSGDDAATYLARCVPEPMPPSWAALTELLRCRRHAVLTEALSSPLMLALVRDTYGVDDSVDELADTQRFPSRRALEEHLLARILPSAYAARPGRPAQRYTLAQAERWLKYLAQRMNQDSTRDLAWWCVPRWKPRRFRIFVSVLVSGLIGGLVSGLWLGPVFGLTFGAALGLTLGLWSGVWSGSGLAYPGRIGRLRWNEVVTRRGLAAGLRPRLGSGLESGHMPRAGSGLVFGLLPGLWSGFLSEYLPRPWSGIVFGLASGLVFVFGIRAASGLGSRLGTGFVELFIADTEPAEGADGMVTPLGSWQGDRRRMITSGLVSGLALAVWSGAGSILGSGPVSSLGSGLVSGLASGLVFGIAFSAVWPATLAFVQLWWAGQGPIRMMRFLEDARDREVLRAVGAVYQFRHAALQDVLAGSAADAQVAGGDGAEAFPST